jgi:hypothetical protein
MSLRAGEYHLCPELSIGVNRAQAKRKPKSKRSRGTRNMNLVEAAGVELHKSFCFCNLQIPQDRKNLKIDDSQGHRTVIVQSDPTSHRCKTCDRIAYLTTVDLREVEPLPATLGQDPSGSVLTAPATLAIPTLRRMFPNHRPRILGLPTEAELAKKSQWLSAPASAAGDHRRRHR